MFSSYVLILLASAGLFEARSILDTRHLGLHRRADSLTLLDSVIQKGSSVDGSQEIGADEVNQAKSATSTNNFINFCSGKTLTNGLQITTGSCNGIPMGDIPSKTNMVSSIIVFPQTGTASKLQADTTFQIQVQMANLVAGSFTNADATYYSAPQALENGLVVGHTHVTVQDMGSDLYPTEALDATQFAFFKGINDAGNGKLLLSANVTGGLPAGNYRVCTIASASNHQSVLMPVAQRGSADDCTKFTVGGNGNTANVASNDGSAGVAAAAAAASAVAAGPGAVDPSLDSTASNVADSAASAASTTKKNSGNPKTTSVSKAAKATKASNNKASKVTTLAEAPFSNSTATFSSSSE